MAVDLAYMLENLDGESPGDLAVAPGATQATLFFTVKRKDIYDVFWFVLGYVYVSDKVWGPGQVGGLKRQVEMSHPRYPYLYADSIDIVGVKAAGKMAAESFTVANSIFRTNDPDRQVPIDYRTFPYQAVYDMYRIAVTFRTRNYFVLTDQQLEPAILQGGAAPPKYTFWQRDNTQNSKVKAVQYTDYREYLRYTEIKIEPGNDVIVSGDGKFYWKSAPPGEVQPEEPAPFAETPLVAQNASVNFINITKNKVRITWNKVPKSVALSDKYTRYAAQCNFGPNFNDDEGDFETFNYNFFNYAPGTLLYTGYTVSEPSCPYPILGFSGKTDNDLLNNVLKNQTVNITFEFIQYTIPEDQRVQPFLDIIWNPEFGKMITNGWNFVPLPNRMFYYVESNNEANKTIAWPPYWSFSPQVLWDPGHA